jgi:RNA polymerase sigma factor (sigma-70 family)
MTHGQRIRHFDVIMQAHGGFLKGLLWKLTGNREAFADAWQDAMLAVWKHVGEMDGPGARSYLYRIAFSSASRTWRTRPLSSLEEDCTVAAGGKTPDQAAGDADLCEVVRRAIADLGHQQGQAVVMRYLEEKEYAHLASELGCTEVAARSHVSKALAALRQKLSGIFDKETTRER